MDNLAIADGMVPAVAGAALPQWFHAQAEHLAEAINFVRWLRQPGSDIDVSSLEAFEHSLDKVPVSDCTKAFFKKCTRALPNVSNKCILRCRYSGTHAVIRDDYTQLLRDLGDQGFGIVVVHGPRCTGKTMGCLNSLLLARQQVLQKYDRCVVLASDFDLPVEHLKAILCICLHYGLPMVLDGLADLMLCAKGIKGFVEDAALTGLQEKPLSVVLIEYDQLGMHAASVRALCDLHYNGTASPVTLLPPPSLGLIVTMLRVRHPQMQDDEFAEHVLGCLTQSGPSLMQHWAGAPPTAEQIVTRHISSLTYLPIKLAPAVYHINNDSNLELNDQSLFSEISEDIRMLAWCGFIRPRSLAGHLLARLYDYNDYRLITYKILKALPRNSDDLTAALHEAEGQVLREIIRTEEGSMVLATLLGLQAAWAENRVLRFYGPPLSSHSLPMGQEVDMLLVEQVAAGSSGSDDGQQHCNLLLCSVKRAESQQDLEGFLQQIYNLPTIARELSEQLSRAKQLTLVAISCTPGDGALEQTLLGLGNTCRLPVAHGPDHQHNLESQEIQQLQGSRKNLSSQVSVQVCPPKRVLFNDLIAAAQLTEYGMPWAEVCIV